MSESPPQPKPFSWSRKSEQAAFLIADRTATAIQIAEQCGVTDRTLRNWRAHSEFAGRVATIKVELRERILSEGYANKDERRAAYQRDLDRMDQLLLERGADMAGEVPGGGTGLLIRIPKNITISYQPDPEDPDSRPSIHRTEAFLYQTDTGLLKERRELFKQVAIEEGQFTEKQELSGSQAQPLTVVFMPRTDGPQ